eukprot:TRINITY_DN3600_c4_g1_i2.p1 TRINITY_DN3600_c4_g1~~TRINITY_DN3600_c4_g1_i2.p1  ORF type:complete len:655 (-),score=43.93 TRINITY_DN3600_c4_g1_i2:13-1977(-)
MGKLVSDNLAFLIENDLTEIVSHDSIYYTVSRGLWKIRTIACIPRICYITPFWYHLICILFYALFVGILTYSLSSGSAAPYHLLTQRLQGTALANTGDVKDFDSFWSWLSGTLLPGIKSDFPDHTLILSSPIYLHQIRLNAEPCSDSVRSVVPLCYPRIQYYLNPIYKNQNDTFLSTFQEDSEKQFGTQLGLYAYSQYGFTVSIPYNTNQTLSNLIIEDLKNSSWIDWSTQVLKIAFVTYSPNSRLYAVVGVEYEFTNFGEITVSQDVALIPQEKISPDYVYGKDKLVLFIYYSSFLLQEIWNMLFKPMVYCIGRVWIKIPNFRPDQTFGKHLTLYLSEKWNIYMIVLSICGLLNLVIHPIYEPDPLNVNLKEFWKIIYQYQSAEVIGSIVGVLSWMRFTFFALPSQTYGSFVVIFFNMFKDFFQWLLLLIVIVAGFASSFDILYASTDPSFAGFAVSFVTTFQSSFSPLDLPSSYNFMLLPFPTSGGVFRIMFLLISAILLLNMLIAILTKTVEAVHEDALRYTRWESSKFVQQFKKYSLPNWPPPTNVISMIFNFAHMLSIFCGSLRITYGYCWFTLHTFSSTQHNSKLFLNVQRQYWLNHVPDIVDYNIGEGFESYSNDTGQDTSDINGLAPPSSRRRSTRRPSFVAMMKS